LLGLPAVAFAQSGSESAAAQALFDQAKALMAAGRSTEACPKLEESQMLDPSSGTLVNLARCYEQSGHIASAWSEYLEAAAAAAVSGNVERETAARALAAALAPHVSHLVVRVDASARLDGLEIRRDGEHVGAPQWGAPIPADAGKHVVSASAPGHVAWKTEVLVNSEGAGTTMIVRVPVLDSAPVEPAPERASRPAEAPQFRASLGAQRVLALVAGGVGVAGLGLGTVLGLKSSSEHDEAERYCNGAACTEPRGVTAGDDAIAAGNLATTCFIIGGVGLTGGLALWFTAPSSSAPPAEVSVGPGSVYLRGRF
jgi:hypothetical protein